MREDRKTAPGVSGTEGGGVEKAVGTTDSYYKLYRNQGPISSVLMTGKGNALPGREIKRILGFRGTRDVTVQVERERRAGVPICATCDHRSPGYFLPGSPTELEEYLLSLQGRINEVAVTRDALETVFCEWTGQQRFDMQEVGEEHV